MCGIVGAVGCDGAPPRALQEKILRTLAHRGPDAEGSRFEHGVWLGFRRLAILDLRHDADQPMEHVPTGTVLVFNGEIYNFLELRRELEAKGHVFTTTGDSEVLLKGYVEWGRDVFRKCEGMWAAAILDPRSEGVLLARDRFGEKPLFVGRHPDGSWWFASEPSALLAAGAGTGRLDLRRAAGFLLLGDVDDPTGSYCEGIVQVAPGHIARLTARGLREQEPWWRLDEMVDRAWSGPIPDPGEVLDALDRSVRLRLRSDVRVGTSLSGGTDSTLLLATMRAVDASREIHAFTASFPGDPVDEWERAADMASRVGAVAHRVEPSPEGFLNDLDRLLECQGGPIESPTVYAQYQVMAAARSEGVVVLLDGQGADETWGGYPKYVWFTLAEHLLAGRPDLAGHVHRTWRQLGGLPSIDIRQVVSLAAGERVRRTLLYAAVRRAEGDLGPALRRVVPHDPQAGRRPGRLLQRAAEIDGGRVILPRLLRYADRNSMAWSREVRLPYLDQEVAALAFRSCWSEGLSTGWTKAALRDAAALRVPDSIVRNRVKAAYEVPDARWLSHVGVREAIDEAARALTCLGLLDGERMARDKPWRVLSLARFVQVSGLTV